MLRIKWQTLFQQDQYPEAALEAIRAAEKDIRFLADAKPDTLRYKEELARTLSLIGWSAQEVSDRSLPDAAHREAVALARTILTESPKSVNASLALAYGLQWNAMSVTAKDKTYEAYETSVPLYKEAILAFKNLAKLEPGNKGYATDHAQVWYGLGQIYHELGDDEEAFKAIRLSYYLLQDASDAHPNDANLHRRAYQLGLHTSEFLSFGEERLAWLERMKSRLKEIEAIGKLHPDDKTLIDEVDRQIGLNKDVIETSKE